MVLTVADSSADTLRWNTMSRDMSGVRRVAMTISSSEVSARTGEIQKEGSSAEAKRTVS